MAFSFTAVRAAVATAVTTGTGLVAHATAPGTVNPPCVVVLPAPGVFINYSVSMDGAADINLTVKLLVSSAEDTIGQTSLDAYLDYAGASSVAAAIQADQDLGGVAHAVSVDTAGNWGLHELGDLSYWGCDFAVRVSVF